MIKFRRVDSIPNVELLKGSDTDRVIDAFLKKRQKYAEVVGENAKRSSYYNARAKKAKKPVLAVGRRGKLYLINLKLVKM